MSIAYWFETSLIFTHAYILVEGVYRHRTRNVQWPSNRRSIFARNTYISNKGKSAKVMGCYS